MAENVAGELPHAVLMAATAHDLVDRISDPMELLGCSIDGTHDCWGNARVLADGERLNERSTAEVLVVDDLRLEHLPHLTAFVGVVIATAGPWEGVIPGTLVDDFRRSALGGLLRRLDIPHVWNLPLVTAAIHTGDLVQIDPHAGTLLCLPLS
jgi:phosphohistidine swiveling domain-containing protein